MYPTAVETTPGTRRNAASTPQKQPAPNVAFFIGSRGLLQASVEELLDDLDAFLADVDVASAAITVGMIEQVNMVGFGYETLGEADVVVSFDGDCDATTGTIKLAVYYVVD